MNFTHAKLLLSAAAAICIVGCGASQTNSSATSPNQPDDKTIAAEVWQEAKNYRSWSALPDAEGWQSGYSVHGDHIKMFGNATVLADFKNLPAGSIIVKEGYTAKRDDALKAITVMKKIPGYAPDAGDWFFARFNEAGKATRINRGCVSCHEDADGEDFFFAND